MEFIAKICAIIGLIVIAGFALSGIYLIMDGNEWWSQKFRMIVGILQIIFGTIAFIYYWVNVREFFTKNDI